MLDSNHFLDCIDSWTGNPIIPPYSPYSFFHTQFKNALDIASEGYYSQDLFLLDGGFFFDNDANQLSEVREGGASGELVSRYYYNHDGRRIKKVEYAGGEVSNVTYYVGRDFEVQNYSGTTYNVTYYMANGELVGRKDPDGSKYYYHNDHLGGTHVVTNSSGGVVERTRYYPYGKLLKGGDSKYTFTGQEDDKESNLMYYGGRYYHPEIRRFTQPDPILQYPYNPQQINRYSYVANNPVKYIDPTGKTVRYAGGMISIGTCINNCLDNSETRTGGGFSISGGVVLGTSSSGHATIGLYLRTGKGGITPSFSGGYEIGYSPNMETVEEFSGETVDVGSSIELWYITAKQKSLGVEVTYPVDEKGNLDYSKPIYQYSEGRVSLPIPAEMHVTKSNTQVYTPYELLEQIEPILREIVSSIYKGEEDSEVKND